jgi:aspartokinase-like uncharacterized kinase
MKVVLKIGGSLIKESPELVKRLKEEFSPENRKFKEISSSDNLPEFTPESILIVPGGGIFADIVRKVDAGFSLSSDAAHWMAILAMEQYAFYLQDGSKANAVDSIENLPRGVSILFPYKLLRMEDPLPHTWQVTSDTIAAWVAKKIGARLIKVTDVDGIFSENNLITEIPAAELTGNFKSCVDLALPHYLLENRMDCLVLNGKSPERVICALYGKPVPGTTVKGNI